MGWKVSRGAALTWRDRSLASLVLDRARRHAAQPAFMVRDAQGSFATWNWEEVGARVREVAAGLASLGVVPGDKVAILGDTRAEWTLADFGTLVAGGVTVTVYPTLTPEQVLHLLDDSGAKVVFVDTAAQQEKLAGIADRAAALQRWVAMDAVAVQDKRALSFADLLAAGRAALAADPELADRRAQAVEPGDVSTIIYTSGTTGVPKGAVLTHENWVSAQRSMIEVFRLEDYDDRRTIAFLPAAHVLTRLMVLTLTDVGGCVAFSSPRTLAQDLQAIQPSTIVCVPRIWERMHQQIHKTVAQMPARRQRIFRAAEAVAMEYGRALADGGRPGLALRAKHAVFEALVYRKLRARLGFSRLEGALSTAAAIRPDLLYFYQGIGVDVFELWGLTELAGPGTTNTQDRFRPGTVGWAIPGVEVALDEEGEVLVAGPNVFVGYHRRPEENAASFVERDGRRWFRTGDVGEFDAAGALRIVDRKKEIEVLDTGKKIAPISVEERLKAVSPFVADSCLVATGRKFAGMLVQPDFDKLVLWARAQGVPFDEARVVVRPDPTGAPMTVAVGDDLLAHPRVRALFEAEIAKCNRECADFEQVRTFHLVPHAFTVDRDELTPTLKKKRRVIVARYKEDIEAMFARGQA